MSKRTTLPDHSHLRALLDAIEHAKKDSAMLNLLRNLAAEDFQDVQIYITSLTDELSNQQYSTYTAEEGEEARLRLEKKARGDFLEAALALCDDIRNWYGPNPDSLKTSGFLSKYFNEEDYKIWTETYQPFRKIWLKAKYDEGEAEGVILGKIRDYLQKYLGPLNKTTLATYMNSDRTSGASVRFIHLGQKLYVSGDSKLDEEAKKILATGPAIIPQEIAGMKLEDTTASLLFDYEL